MKKLFSLVCLTFFMQTVFAQIGINTTTPNGALDITSTTNGIVIPRVALTATNASSPVVNPAGGSLVDGTLVYNTATAGSAPNNVIPGFYYWSSTVWVPLASSSTSTDWSLTGNTGISGGNTTTAATNFIGTTDSKNFDFRTNNTFVARFTPLGQFLFNSLAPRYTNDLMSTIARSDSYAWALNGYSDYNGGGVYGEVSSGTTNYAAVQGQYRGTSVNGAGVRGIYNTTTSGTDYDNSPAGVSGSATSSGNYKFGVFGLSGAVSYRTGGVMGSNYGYSRAALGYYNSVGTNISTCGFGTSYSTGTTTSRMSGNTDPLANKMDNTIGSAFYGGVMGGWVRGLKFGFHTKGETYSLYVDGKGFTNEPLTYLIPTSEEKVAGYMSTAATPEMSCRGKLALVNGKVFVPFSANFKRVLSSLEDLTITATPQGKSQGVYIDQITNDGFWIIENNEGQSNVSIAWMAVTTIKGQENLVVPSELQAKDFDQKMDGVMFNEANLNESAQPIWWDGTKIRWDKIPAQKPKNEIPIFSKK